MGIHSDREARLFLQFVASKRVLCPVCGYDLNSAASTRCPECGELLEIYLHHAKWAVRRRLLVVFAGLSLAAGLLTLLMLELDELRRGRRAGRLVFLTIGLIIVAAASGLAFARLDPWRLVRRFTESESRRAGRLSVLRGLLGSNSVWCPVRKTIVTELRHDEWCPACAERIRVRIRPVGVRSMLDGRVRWISAGIMLFVSCTCINVAILVTAVINWQNPAGSSLTLTSARLLFINGALLVVASNILAGTWLFIRRASLMRRPRAFGAVEMWAALQPIAIVLLVLLAFGAAGGPG